VIGRKRRFQVGEAEVQSPQNVVHEVLKRLRGVAQAEEHEGEHEDAKGSGDGGFLYIAGMRGNLVVCPLQTDLWEEATTRELMGVIMYVMDGKEVGNNSGVQRSIVSVATTVVLRHDI
jgi:hypothetical protein